MYVRHGRLTALCALTLSVAALAFASAFWLNLTHIETKLPSIPKLYNSQKTSHSQHAEQKALSLEKLCIIDHKALARLPLYASHILSRPDGLKDAKAIYLAMNSQEHLARLDAPIYLKRGIGNLWNFAEEGEKTPVWIIPHRKSQDLYFSAYVQTQRAVEDLGSFQLPVHAGGNWPDEGLTYQGVQLDGKLFERLKVRWCGQNLLSSSGKELLFFEDRVVAVSPNDWLMIKEGKFAVASLRDHTETSPLLKLKRREKDHLLFELIDSDGLLHLTLSLPKSDDKLDENTFRELGKPILRRLEAVQFPGTQGRLSLKENEALLFSGGEWKKADPKVCGFGPLVVVEKIDLSKEILKVRVTLYSAMRSVKQEMEYTLKPPRRLKL